MWGGVIYVHVYRQKVKAVHTWGLVRWLYSSHYAIAGVVRCGNQKVVGTLDSLLLYGSMYVSQMLADIGLCLYEGICQIRWLPQVSASMEVCVRYAGCHRAQVYVSMEVCVRHADCHRSLSLWKCVYDYSVGWCHICSGL